VEAIVKHGFLAARLILLAALVCAWAAPAPAVETLLTLDGEAAGDQFGVCVSTSGDFNGDGYMDFVVTAWGNDTGGTDSGRAYVYLGGPVLGTAPDLVITGSGYRDLLCVAAKDMPAFDSGAVWLHFGGPGLDAVPEFTFGGENRADWFGSSMDWVGDLNGDGYNDLAISASRYPSVGDRGRVYIFFWATSNG
jgi:hypothetical protein